MSGIRVSRRSLNSVAQDLAPLMTIEDDDVDDDIDEGVNCTRPSTSTIASSLPNATPLSRGPNSSAAFSPDAPVSFSPTTTTDVFPKRFHAQNSSSLEESDAERIKTTTPKASPCLKWTFGFGLIVAGTVLNTSTPIYTLIMSENSDIFTMNLFITFWSAFIFLLIWVFQCCFFSKNLRDEEERHKRLYFRPKFASFKTLASLALINTVVNILISFAMLPSRTPKVLQAILVSGAVVSATVFRKLVLNRGVSVRRVICLGAVLLGLFVAAEPEIFDLPLTKIVHHGKGIGSREKAFVGGGGRGGAGNTTILHPPFSGLWTYKTPLSSSFGDDPPMIPTSHSIFWTLMLLLSNVPAGLAWVLFEREASRRPKEVFLINFYAQIGSLFCLLALFWIDLAPGFGQASSVSNFGQRLINGFLCHFHSSALPGTSHCNQALVVSFSCIAAFTSFMTFQVLLMAFTEGGSTFSIIVSYLSVPASSVFWMLFDYELNEGFIWSPLVSFTSLFPIVGFTIMLPAIILFNVIGSWENQVTFDY